MKHSHYTSVNLSDEFTTKLNEAGTLEIYYEGRLIGDIWNTDARPVKYDGSL